MRVKNIFLCLSALGFSSYTLALSPVYEEPEVDFVATKTWGSKGYCGEIRVTATQQELRAWHVTATVHGSIANVWNGSYEVASKPNQEVVFRPAEWNATVPVGGSTAIGVCGSGKMPQDLTVSSETSDTDAGVTEELKINELAYGSHTMEPVDKHYQVANTTSDLAAIEGVIGQKLNVDMDNNTVIGAFMGFRSTGGYSIKVTEAAVTEEGVILSVRLTSPGRNCPVTLATTSPYQVVSINKTDKPIAIKESSEIYNCD